MKRTIYLITILALFISGNILDLNAQFNLKFRDKADSLDYWQHRRFRLSGLKGYTQQEINLMEQAGINRLNESKRITGGDSIQHPNLPLEEPFEEIRSKIIRSGGETVYSPMVAVSPIDQWNFVSVYTATVSSVKKSRASYSINGGSTWVASDVPTSLSLYDKKDDACIAFSKEGENGRAYYCYSDYDKIENVSNKNAIVVVSSDNKGSGWGNKKIVINDENPATHNFNDKPWIACDISGSNFNNSVYVSWTRFSSGGAYSEILFSHKRVGDNENFSDPINISGDAVSGDENVQYSNLLVAPDGTIYVFWLRMNENTGSGNLWMNSSADGGITFGTPHIFLTNGVQNVKPYVLGGNFQHANCAPYATVKQIDAQNYEIYLVWNTYSGEPQVWFAKWRTGWTQWTVQGTIDLGYQQFMPSITAGKRGIAIAYYDKVNDNPSNNEIQLKVAESTNGGSTFSSASTYQSFAGNTTFTGDYIGIAANDYTYWAVYPSLVASGDNDIAGNFVGVRSTIKNQFPFSISSAIQYDGSSYFSPYTLINYVVTGTKKTIKASDPKIHNGNTYSFLKWVYEDGSDIPNGTTQEITLPMEKHTYTAKFEIKYKVNVSNNFNGGKFSTDGQEYNNTTQTGIDFPWFKNTQHTLLAFDNQIPPDGILRSFDTWGNDGTSFGDGNLEVATYPVTENTEYKANFWKVFNVNISEAQYIEGGSGGLYNIIGSDGTHYDNVLSWSGTYKENSPNPLLLEAVPPNSDYFLLQWSDGNTSNPRNLTPADHVYGLHAIFKKHLASNTPIATGSNAQAKLSRDDGGDFYLTYESGNNIYTTHSTDLTEWTNEEGVLSQGGAAIRRGSSTINTELNGISRTVYEVVADAEGMTEHQIVAIEGSYVIQIASFSADATFEATPIITYGTMPERDNVICVVWSQPDGIFLATKYHRQHYYTEPIVIIDRHDVSTPSIAMEKITTGEQNNAPWGYYFHFVWKQENEILYRKGYFRIGENYVQLEWDYSTTYEITREHPELVHKGNPSVTLFQEDATESGSSLPHIFFDAIEGDNPNKNENHSIFYITQNDGHWTELVQFIHRQEFGVFHDELYPNAVVEQNNILRCVWQCNNHLMNITRDLSTNAEWSEATYIGGDESIGKDGKYPNLYYDALFDNTTYAVWGAESENLYNIRTYQFTSSFAKNKETTTDVIQIRRGSVHIEEYKIGNDGVLNGGLWVTMY
ncbi:MAG: hypothetical protein AAB071_04210, partial [Bacteroidota bacterium]